MSLKEEIQQALDARGLAPNKRFGQHFMIDLASVQALVGSLKLDAHAHVVEIGPGTGILTKRLLETGAHTLACEIDAGMVAWLQQYLVPEGLQLVHGDALASKTRLHPDVEAFIGDQPWCMGANLPYDISIPLLLNCMSLANPPRCLSVTVQYEAATRLCAQPGSKAWGASAALAQAAGQGKIIRKLPPQCFWPPPRVDSAIYFWQPQRTIPEGFGLWCRSVFAYRRKRLPRALRDNGMA